MFKDKIELYRTDFYCYSLKAMKDCIERFTDTVSSDVAFWCNQVIKALICQLNNYLFKEDENDNETRND